jgi:DNA-binding XRE family transcriptional regulator
MGRPKKRFTLSERLKMARAERNISVDALTKEAGVQYITYSKIEQ